MCSLNIKLRELDEKIEESRTNNELGKRMTGVSIYTISTCPVCRKTKELFRTRSIPFHFIDYDLSSENEQNKIAVETMSGTGDLGSPFVTIDSVVVTGFNPERFEQLLN